MFRTRAYLATLAVAAVLAGCSTGGNSAGGAAPATPAGNDGRCEASGADFAIGKPASAELLEQARKASGSQMARILKAAMAHRGFAFVDMLQACPTYNYFATHNYLMERCYEPENHDTSDFHKARALAIDTSEKIATGILYQNENIPSFYENLVPRQGKKTQLVDEVVSQDIGVLMGKLV